jgi:hypothetical protein
MRTRLLLPVVGLTVLAAVSAGCGNTSRNAGTTTRVTVPGYGVFPEATVTGAAAKGGDSPACRSAARSFAHDAADLLAHFGPKSAYPADLAFVNLRGVLADFRARRCNLPVLGRELERRLTAKQRAELVDDLPSAMAATVSEVLAR